jgi:hypothetical protein
MDSPVVLLFTGTGATKVPTPLNENMHAIMHDLAVRCGARKIDWLPAVAQFDRRERNFNLQTRCIDS